MKRASKTLQVRMDIDLLAALVKRAQDMGYSSTPAYVRAWAAGEVNQVNNNDQVINTVSVLALRYVELLLAARSPQAPNVDAALDYVRRQLAARSWRAHMRTIGFRVRH